MERTVLLVVGLGLCAQLNAQGQDAHAHATPVRPPQRFVENKGQWPAHVRYRAEFGTASMFAEADGITWSMLQADAGERVHDLLHADSKAQAAFRLHGHAWRMLFVDANGDPAVTSFDRSTTYLNYFLGNDPRKWAGHVGVFGEVLYEEVWNGVDLKLHSEKGAFKYDVLLDANADVSKVRFRYEGLDALTKDAEGRLVLRTSVSDLLEMAPVAWYADGAHEKVDCRFTLENGTVGFTLGQGTNTQRPIVIDPVLIASTLSGCSGASNYGHCATYDDAGNIYTGARNFGPSYPATVGAFQTTFGGGGTDMSFSKYNADGSQLLWASYLGGSGGENPHSLIVDAQGKLCVMGSTASTDFPVSPSAFSSVHNGGGNDMTITVFSSDGASLFGSTYLGGSANDGTNVMWGNYGEAYRGEVFLDAAGNVMVAGFSESADFPVTTGALQSAHGGQQDGVVLSISPDCSNLLWSTFFGGSGDDGAFGLRIANNSVYVCGSTESANLTTTAGAFQEVALGDRDGWVARLSTDGSTLQACTRFGTSASDRPYFLDTDNDGNVWIYGQSDGQVPVQPVGTYANPGGEIFVAKLSGDLSASPVSTMIGGGTAPVAFLVDHCNHIYLSGFNSSGALPTTPDMFYSTGSFWLAVFEIDMSGLLFGTHYGGSHVDGGTSRFDKDGVVYQGVCSGTGSLQTTAWAWSQTQSVGWDIGVFKIDFQQSGVNANISASATAGCAPATIDFNAVGQYFTVEWDFGDGSPTSTLDDPSHLYQDPGTYTVTLIATDPASCNLADTTTLLVVIGTAEPVEPEFTVSQAGACEPYMVVTVNNSTGPNNTYLWNMGDGTTYTTTNVTHTYAGPGTYDITLTVTDNTCGGVDSTTIPVTVTEPAGIEALFSAVQVDQCSGFIVSTQNMSTGPSGLVYTWDMGDGTVLTGTEVTHTYTEQGTFTITLTAYDPLCDEDDTFTLDVPVLASPLVGNGILVPNIFSPNQDGYNDTFFPIDGAGSNVTLKVWNRWGMKMFETAGAYKPWNGRTPGNKPVPDGVYFYILEYSIPCTGERIEGKEEGYVHVVGSTM